MTRLTMLPMENSNVASIPPTVKKVMTGQSTRGTAGVVVVVECAKLPPVNHPSIIGLVNVGGGNECTDAVIIVPFLPPWKKEKEEEEPNWQILTIAMGWIVPKERTWYASVLGLSLVTTSYL